MQALDHVIRVLMRHHWPWSRRLSQEPEEDKRQRRRVESVTGAQSHGGSGQERQRPVWSTLSRCPGVR